MHPATLRTGLAALLTAAFLPPVIAAPASAETLERIRDSGKIMLGYRADTRPFSYQDESGKPAGYTIELCQAIADSIKSELGLSALTAEWVPVAVEDRFQAIKDTKIDLLCAADAETLSRRKDVAFSIPVFESGIGALVRADAPLPLREVLGGQTPSGPLWRGSPARVLAQKTFSAVSGSTSESWLRGKVAQFQLAANVAPVDSYAAGIDRVLDRGVDVFFGDRSVLVDAVQSNPSGGDLLVIDRYFTSAPVALALARGDEDFRLAVDRALSGVYGLPSFRDLYLKWFGEPDEKTLAFFRTNTLPE